MLLNATLNFIQKLYRWFPVSYWAHYYPRSSRQKEPPLSLSQNLTWTSRFIQLLSLSR